MLAEYGMTYQQFNELTDEQLLLILIKRRERITGVRPRSVVSSSGVTKEEMFAYMGIEE